MVHFENQLIRVKLKITLSVWAFLRGLVGEVVLNDGAPPRERRRSLEQDTALVLFKVVSCDTWQLENSIDPLTQKEISRRSFKVQKQTNPEVG